MAQTTLVSDLNVVPTENDGEVCGITDLPDTVARTTYNPINQVKVASASDAIDQMKMASVIKYIDVKEGEGKMLVRFKMPFDKSGEQPIDTVSYADSDQKCQLVSTSRKEKVCSLKAGLVHVARKVPKNAHAHFILGLMYQRLGQPQKAVLAFEKSSEILLKCEEEISRPDLLSLVQIHHAQCLLQGSSRDGLDKELDLENLDEILLKMKESLSFDIRQSSVWNTLGLILLQTGRVQSAISILSSLLKIVPDYLDVLANLGMAYLQKGNLELSQKCFQDLILKDQNHPAALINYGALLLCKHGSVIAGPGAHADEGACESQAVAANVATECLLAAVRQEPKSAQLWMNLANAYYLGGNHQGTGKCLEQAAKLNPTLMSIRFAVAVHRIKDAEKFQDPTEQLSWAANEMASILKYGDPNIIEPQVAWAGMAMVHRAQHQISSTFGTEQKGLTTIEEQALYSLKQAVQVKPEDSVSWHQLGLHDLCTLQFKRSQKYLKAAVARNMESCYAWSNLGVSLQLSEEDSDAEEVYKRALSLSTNQQAHTVLSNLGNLHRQQEQFGLARSLFAKSLEICPGYAPAYNNLGLVYVAERRWEDAKSCFRKSLEGDPLLDAAKSNLMKAIAMSKCTATETSVFEDKRVAANFL